MKLNNQDHSKMGGHLGSMHFVFFDQLKAIHLEETEEVTKYTVFFTWNFAHKHTPTQLKFDEFLWLICQFACSY